MRGEKGFRSSKRLGQDIYRLVELHYITAVHYYSLLYISCFLVLGAVRHHTVWQHFVSSHTDSRLHKYSRILYGIVWQWLADATTRELRAESDWQQQSSSSTITSGTTSSQTWHEPPSQWSRALCRRDSHSSTSSSDVGCPTCLAVCRAAGASQLLPQWPVRSGNWASS